VRHLARTATGPARVAVAIALLACQHSTDAQGQSPSQSPPPALVVLVVLDQFRADYIPTYSKAWSGGLHEIVTKGAYFTEAAYPYATTKTCAGHGSIATGLLPSTHGLIDNGWFDPTTRAFVNCTEDPSARALTFGGTHGEEHHSAARLMAPTFAEQLQRQSNGRARVVSLSVKARSAIGMAGHGGPNTTIVWSEDMPGVWSTSSALTRRPSPDVDAYVRAHPTVASQFQTWERARPAADYLFPDRAPGEPPTGGTFPHLYEEPIRLTRTTATLLDSWDSTPFPDVFLKGLATHLVERQRLGQDRGTDFLAISFSGLDFVGHTFGPRSHEVQDTLFRLDQLLGELLATLDARVGRGRYVLALTSDHGISPLPEQAFPAADGRAVNGPVTGRTTLAAIGNAIEAVLDKEFGRGSYVEAMAGSYVYFRPGVLARITANPTIVKAVEAAALGARGMAKVYWSTDLVSHAPTDDPVLAAVRRSYYPGRSGDLAWVLQPNWVTTTAANHGSPYPDDTRVPVVFFGAGIAPGRHASAASPLDIAPTLAALAGVRMGKMDGRVLQEALAPLVR
jgi:predicted AlkP superfamily pyrophosphatase or phosphodiesterase